MNSRIIIIALVAALAGIAPAQDKNIVETAVAAGNFKTLATALTKADLVETLQGKGPFTVFAPTDAAFAKLPNGVLEHLIQPANKAKLTSILTYHVVAGRVPASEAVKLSAAPTVNGQRAAISVTDEGVTISGARIIKTDIHCSNGIIHVIDAVMLPVSKNIVETAAEAKTFNTLLAAAKAAGLADTLANGGPFTLFAPTDAAFAKLPEGTVESLLEPHNRGKLADILKLHVVSGRVYADQVLAAKKAKTLQGETLMVKTSKMGVWIGSAKIVTTDIQSSNGVIHVIDSVLIPTESTKTSTKSSTGSCTGGSCNGTSGS